LYFLCNPFKTPPVKKHSWKHWLDRWKNTAVVSGDTIKQFTDTDTLADPVVVIEAIGTWIPTHTVTPSDTLAVEVGIITTADSTAIIGITIDSIPVSIDTIIPIVSIPQLQVRRWVLLAEYSNAGVGVGIGYRLFDISNYSISPCITMDINTAWVAGTVRVSKKVWSGVAVGIGAGYRYDDGFHLSGSISIEL